MNTSHISFKLKYRYYFCLFFKTNTNFYLRLKITNKLPNKLKDFITIY